MRTCSCSLAGTEACKKCANNDEELFKTFFDKTFFNKKDDKSWEKMYDVYEALRGEIEEKNEIIESYKEVERRYIEKLNNVTLHQNGVVMYRSLFDEIAVVIKHFDKDLYERLMKGSYDTAIRTS